MNTGDEDPEQESSSKWSLKFLKKYLIKKFKDKILRHQACEDDVYQPCFDVIIKTLIACELPIVNELNKLGNR